jgi:hypothetical protein
MQRIVSDRPRRYSLIGWPTTSSAVAAGSAGSRWRSALTVEMNCPRISAVMAPGCSSRRCRLAVSVLISRAGCSRVRSRQALRSVSAGSESGYSMMISKSSAIRRFAMVS